MMGSTDPSEGLVLVTRHEGIAHVTLNRPERRNAISLDLRQRLTATLEALADDPSVGALLLSGRGRSFCSGGDVSELAEVSTSPDESRMRVEAGNRMMRALVAFPTPVVAAVRGAAAGAGISLALGADIVVAGEDAEFHFAFTRIGLGPDAGMSRLLADRVGPARARSLLLAAGSLDANEGLRHGLVDEVVPVHRLMSRASERAADMAARPREANVATKRLLLDVEDFERCLEAELESQVNLLSTDGHARARAQFLRRRSSKQGANE